MDDARAHHADLRQRTQALLTRYLQRYWYRAVQGGGSLGDLFVTVEEVVAELEVGQLKPPFDFAPPAQVQLRIDQLRADEATRRAATPGLPAARLAREARLDADALELVLVLATLQSSPGLLRASTFAWADFSVKQPTAGFVVELLADDPAHRARLERALAPDGVLRRLRLVQLGEDRRWQPATPLLQRPAFVPDAVQRFLAGGAVVGEVYPTGAVAHEIEGPRPEALVLHDALRLGRLLGGLARREDEAPLVLVGAPGSGRRTVTRAHALAAGRTLFRIDLVNLPWELEGFEDQLAAALRDGLLAGAVVLVRCEGFDDRGDRRPGVLARLVRTMAVPVVLSATPDVVPLLTPVLDHARVVELFDGPPEVRARLYGHLLRQHGFQVPANELAALVDTYKLRPGDLDRALRDVRISTGDADTARLDDVAFDLAVRRQIRTSLSALATPIQTSQRWDDLVVSEEQMQVIEEILAHARHRTQVFEEWGFARKLGTKGRGLSCLFSGPPGTGKTMTASLIANELGLDLYQVDLSRVVDKYVGETEKNLARLFDEASRVPVVLLFDEADSLFASRTKVESSNDRYANLEVNFLLQRMETYEGISILTTNLGTGIDQAFKRRLRFRLHFDLPKPEEREVLWKSMVPPGCAVADDVDWGFLARRWEMSGALIRNAMVRAAFLAAARGSALTNELLRMAAKSELMEMGRLGS